MTQLLNQIPSFLFISLVFLFTSCQKDAAFESVAEVDATTPVQKEYPNVDSRLWPYFERFEDAGKERGFNIDLNRAAISGDIQALDGEHVAGQCTYSSGNPNHVTVDEVFWENANDNFLEFIIFHELGHCYLGRGHREDAFENGACKSIMRSGLEDCVDNYRSSTRSFYMTELFEPNSI